MTIRESVWFTKDTYAYEEVVRSIPKARGPSTSRDQGFMSLLQILLASHGSIHSVTHIEFVRMYCDLARVDHRTRELMMYVSDLALSRIPVGRFVLLFMLNLFLA